MFEQLISKQVSEFIEPHLSMNLTAYRKIHSCETSLLRLVEEWKRTDGRKEVVGVLSTDMSKAFHSFHPPLLLAKLRAYGFSEHALDLMRSYFTERKSRVRIGTGTTSEWMEVVLKAPRLVRCCGTYFRMT